MQEGIPAGSGYEKGISYRQLRQLAALTELLLDFHMLAF